MSNQQTETLVSLWDYLHEMATQLDCHFTLEDRLQEGFVPRAYYLEIREKGVTRKRCQEPFRWSHQAVNDPTQPDEFIPAPNAAWNELGIQFMSARFERVGDNWERRKCSTVRVVLNGEVLHDQIGLSDENRTGFDETDDLVQDDVYGEGWCKARGPIMLQEHDSRVEFYGIHIDPTWRGDDQWQQDENCISWQ